MNVYELRVWKNVATTQKKLTTYSYKEKRKLNDESSLFSYYPYIKIFFSNCLCFLLASFNVLHITFFIYLARINIYFSLLKKTVTNRKKTSRAYFVCSFLNPILVLLIISWCSCKSFKIVISLRSLFFFSHCFFLYSQVNGQHSVKPLQLFE